MTVGDLSLAFFRFLRRTRSAASLKRKGKAAVRSLQAPEASADEGSQSESWLNLGRSHRSIWLVMAGDGW